MDYCMNALKKTVLDIKWMLLVAVLGAVGGFLVSHSNLTILSMAIAFPIALAIDFMIHLLLDYFGNKNDQQVGRNEKY